MAKSASAVAAKWKNSLANARQAYVDGVNAVTQNPAEKAIRQKQAYVDGVQRAVAEGRFEKGLQRVTLEGYKKAAIDKGSNRLGPGAAAAEGDFTAFMAELLPHVEAGKARLESMPRGDREQNKLRMLAWSDHMASFKRSR